MNIQQLRERRARIVSEMRTLADLAGKEERDLTEDESTKFDGLRADNVKLERQIERAESVAEAERSMAATPVKGSFAEATTQYSLFRAIKGQMDARSVDDALERGDLEVLLHVHREGVHHVRAGSVRAHAGSFPGAVSRQRTDASSRPGAQYQAQRPRL